MPDLNLSAVTRTARNTALEHSLLLEVVGVVLGGAGNDYVEILVNVHGCANQPCQFAIGVFRNATEAALSRPCRHRIGSFSSTSRTSPKIGSSHPSSSDAYGAASLYSVHTELAHCMLSQSPGDSAVAKAARRRS
jgi:hypothetical protein